MPRGDSMNTVTLRLPRIAYSADGPVSPEVAPRMLSVAPLLRKDVLEQIAQQLQRDVLECERRSVGCAQQMQPRLECGQRRDLVAAKGRNGVRALDDRTQVGGRDVVHVARQDLERQLPVAQWAQARELLGGKSRIRLRYREAPVGGRALEQDRGERLR